MTVNTSMFQNIIIPSSSADDILSIVYSTDGTTRLPVVNINRSNWQQGRYAIPIHSWDELKNLQVAFVGLGTATSAPQVFLDGMRVEVRYGDAEPIAPLTSSSTPDSASTTDPNPQDKPDQPQPPPDNQPSVMQIIQHQGGQSDDILDQGAKQKCSVDPFSESIAPGGSARLPLALLSGLSAASSSPSGTPLAPPYQPLYRVSLGSLPPGVWGDIQSQASSVESSTQTISLHASRSVAPGSYSLLVIYRERQEDGTVRSAGCQFNLVIQ